jgi:hypothetical protein
MKKILIIAMIGLMILALTFGCGKKEEPAPTTEPPVTEAPAEETEMMDTMEAMDTTMMEETTEEPAEEPAEGEGEH